MTAKIVELRRLIEEIVDDYALDIGAGVIGRDPTAADRASFAPELMAALEAVEKEIPKG